MNTEITSKRKAVIDAFEKGYRVINNIVEYKGRTRKLHLRFKKQSCLLKYATFGVRDSNGKRVEISVHHLAAYQKYKNFFINEENFFEQKMVVMHKDGDTLNNNLENIYMGTRIEVAQNRLKKWEEERKIHSEWVNNLILEEKRKKK
jgi:RNA binding exosome subunit